MNLTSLWGILKSMWGRFKRLYRERQKARWEAWERKHKEEIVAYVPPHGPVKYALYLIGHRISWTQLPDWLLNSGLIWYWASWPLYEESPSSAFIPLTETTKHILLQELRDHTKDFEMEGYGRTFLFCGFSSSLEAPLSESAIEDTIQEFVKYETGSLQVMIKMIGDDDRTYLYIRRVVDKIVEQWLEGVGVDLTAARKRIRLKSLEW